GMVIQLTMFEGIWSRKISHSASPRNRSSRRSRSGGGVAGTGVSRRTGADGAGSKSTACAKGLTRVCRSVMAPCRLATYAREDIVSPAKMRFTADYTRWRRMVRRLKRAPDLTMYQAITRNITVSVNPKFMPDRSSAEKNYYF